MANGKVHEIGRTFRSAGLNIHVHDTLTIVATCGSKRKYENRVNKVDKREIQAWDVTSESQRRLCIFLLVFVPLACPAFNPDSSNSKFPESALALRLSSLSPTPPPPEIYLVRHAPAKSPRSILLIGTPVSCLTVVSDHSPPRTRQPDPSVALDLNTLLAANDALSRVTPSKMLEPSLLAPAEYYDTPTSERGGPQKKRQGSLQRSVEPPAPLESPPKHPGLERRTSDITSDISLDNLLEGSRRKRNKFSSDLPLLPLPTPTSVVSGSVGHHVRTKSQARERADSASTTRTAQHTPGRVSIPTPAPTTISDEDVAIQLIRLGDPSLSPFKAPPSNESSSPIPSLTTAMQLKALHDAPELLPHDTQPSKREMDYPSSPPASVSDSQDHKEPNGDSTIPDARDHRDAYRVSDYAAHGRPSLGESDYNLKDETDVEDDIEIDIPRPQNLPHFHDSMQCKSHDHGVSLSSTSVSSAAAAAAAANNDDASAERRSSGGPSVGVRCTRCKKSKKGCDRQRPCGRCADANEDCVTEDESSGRRGRNNRGGGRRGKR